MNKKQLHQLVCDVLTDFDPNMGREEAVQLMMGTCATESELGEYIKQLDSGKLKGVALGIFQMEPKSHDDIWINYLSYKPHLIKKVIRYASIRNVDTNAKVAVSSDELRFNLAYAIIMARFQYWRRSEAIPAFDDLDGQGDYYKLWYNSMAGKGSREKYVRDYKRLIG